jgi:hypothetical protein
MTLPTATHRLTVGQVIACGRPKLEAVGFAVTGEEKDKPVTVSARESRAVCAP